VPGYQLVVTEGAELDIAQARQWYEEQAGVGAAFVASIDKQLMFIELQPLALPVVAHDIRRSVVSRFPYNIYFAINGQFINILAVWHGSRDQQRLLSQLSS
jgi:toxin ParE1/3/4